MIEEQALALVIDYVEGDLPPEQRRAVEKFLAQHGDFLTSYQKTISLCGKMLRQPVPAGLAERVIDAVRAAPR